MLLVMVSVHGSDLSFSKEKGCRGVSDCVQVGRGLHKITMKSYELFTDYFVNP